MATCAGTEGTMGRSFLLHRIGELPERALSLPTQPVGRPEPEPLSGPDARSGLRCIFHSEPGGVAPVGADYRRGAAAATSTGHQFSPGGQPGLFLYFWQHL